MTACRLYGIPVWVTEVGVNADGGTASTNTAYRAQKYTMAQRYAQVYGGVMGRQSFP